MRFFHRHRRQRARALVRDVAATGVLLALIAGLACLLAAADWYFLNRR